MSFIPRPGATEEDDGVLISTVMGVPEGRSYLLVLDGKTLTQIVPGMLIDMCAGIVAWSGKQRHRASIDIGARHVYTRVYRHADTDMHGCTLQRTRPLSADPF